MTDKERIALTKEILSVTPEDFCGRYLLAPRFGKTKLGIELIKKRKPKSILWVTPLADLAKVDIPAEFIKWKAKAYLKKLSTCTWKSLEKEVGEYDMIILDEEQFATENNLKTLLNGKLKAKSLITMTGTSSKYEHKQELYQRLGLKIIYRMDINSAVDLGLLANYKINVIQVPMSTEKNIKAGNDKVQFMTSEEKQYEYFDNQFRNAVSQSRLDIPYRMLARMRAIYDSPSKTEVAKYLMSYLKGRKLFFCSSVKQAESICTYTFHNKSDGKDFRNFISGNINEIAMVNKGGTGATYKEIDHLVLVQADSDNNGLTSQKLSRTLLQQEDYLACIWIICLKGTQDEKWIESALGRFDKSKVEYFTFDDLKLSDDFSVFREQGVTEIVMGSKSIKL